MAGPMPPAVGGMVTVARDLCESSLGRDFRIDAFDTAPRTAPGRSLVSAVRIRLRMWRAWWKLLDRTPAIAHVHTCSGLTYFLDIALIAMARLRSVPVVLHVHGGRFDAFLDGLDPVRRYAARVGARLSSCVVVLSEGWRDRLMPRLPGARLVVVENGVPIDTTAPACTDAAMPLILFLGAISRAKGVEDLVRAFAGTSGSASLALVGPEAEPGIAAEMRSLAVELGVGGRLLIPGPVAGSVKTAWLRKASLFVLPSYAEGLPVSLLEAMAAGLAVVATRVGAIPTVLDDDRTGILIDAGDVEGLRRAIERILTSPALRFELGQQARAECIARFSIDRSAEALRGIYRDLATRARGGAVQ